MLGAKRVREELLTGFVTDAPTASQSALRNAPSEINKQKINLFRYRRHMRR